ncbi:hypothetical protein BKA56DRAFT_583499 [Ilyonectria sp. MPI-CAGE-AT-0026]|nr:hypothetical protein BKA56DRAFT_583499 [Ilyonectria sp. MPI-CAGE-AT-0026]
MSATMYPPVFHPGRIIRHRDFDEEHHNFTVTTKIPFIRWPGRDRMPKDCKSREFRDKAHDAVDAFAVDLEKRLRDENRPALLKLACLLMVLHQIELTIPVLSQGHDQRQFYAYVSKAVTKLFIAENWLNPERDIDLDPASSDDGKSPEKDSGKKP